MRSVRPSLRHTGTVTESARAIDMNEYDELWNAIRHSPFMGVYIGELYWLAEHVEKECTAIFGDVQPPVTPGQGYVRVDHALHGRILGVLLAAARIRALIRPRDRHGSRGEKEVLVRRTAALRDLLAGIDLGPVLDGTARNSIEHFDERLDETAIKSRRGSIPWPTLLAFDMVLSTRRLLEQFDVGGERPTTYLIRAYIADERVFANCGVELRLEPLRDCCAAIRARVEPLLPAFAREDRGASMLVVTRTTFAEAT